MASCRLCHFFSCVCVYQYHKVIKIPHKITFFFRRARQWWWCETCKNDIWFICKRIFFYLQLYFGLLLSIVCMCTYAIHIFDFTQFIQNTIDPCILWLKTFSTNNSNDITNYFLCRNGNGVFVCVFADANRERERRKKKK